MNKTISINQPAYLPWLGYFERIDRSDHHIVLDHVQFEKNSMTNRNKINTTNGPLLLSVPLLTSGKFGDLAINNLQIQNSQNWRKKHWQSIYFSYKKAPFFKIYEKEIEHFYSYNWQSFNECLKAQLIFFLDALQITTKISYSSDHCWHHTKSDLILEICQHFSASKYLSGAFGKDYLSLESFRHHTINVEFQDYQHPTYQQMTLPFTSHLSILDLLFNHGDDSIAILRNR